MKQISDQLFCPLVVNGLLLKLIENRSTAGGRWSPDFLQGCVVIEGAMKTSLRFDQMFSSALSKKHFVSMFVVPLIICNRWGTSGSIHVKRMVTYTSGVHHFRRKQFLFQ
jgi:hypothetical protein